MVIYGKKLSLFACLFDISLTLLSDPFQNHLRHILPHGGASDLYLPNIPAIQFKVAIGVVTVCLIRLLVFWKNMLFSVMSMSCPVLLTMFFLLYLFLTASEIKTLHEILVYYRNNYTHLHYRFI